MAVTAERADAAAAWLLGPFVAYFLLDNLVDWSWHLAGLTAIFAAAAGALSVRPLSRAAGATPR